VPDVEYCCFVGFNLVVEELSEENTRPEDREYKTVPQGEKNSSEATATLGFEI
jgi:hypothetical protein